MHVSDTAAAIYEDDDDELVHFQMCVKMIPGSFPCEGAHLTDILYVVPPDTDSTEYEDRQTTDRVESSRVESSPTNEDIRMNDSRGEQRIHVADGDMTAGSFDPSPTSDGISTHHGSGSCTSSFVSWMSWMSLLSLMGLMGDPSSSPESRPRLGL